MGLNAKVTVVGLKSFSKNLRFSTRLMDKQLNIAVAKSALLITQAVKDKTPVKSGNLKKGIYPEFGNLRALIRPHNAPYALWVHDGTKPHIIRPRKKSALFWKGAKHPVKLVRHPGTKAKPFMDEGLEASLPKINKIFDIEINKVLEKLTK